MMARHSALLDRGPLALVRVGLTDSKGEHSFPRPSNAEAGAARGNNTASVAGAAGQSGSITVTHDGGYGELAGKTVALEPSTGFSFDTPMLPRSR
jgi:hypothetical protein